MKNKLTVREKMRLPRPFSGDGDWKYGPQSPPPNFDRPPQSTETEGVKTSSIITRHIRISPSPKLRSGRPWFAGAGFQPANPPSAVSVGGNSAGLAVGMFLRGADANRSFPCGSPNVSRLDSFPQSRNRREICAFAPGHPSLRSSSPPSSFPSPRSTASFHAHSWQFSTDARCNLQHRRAVAKSHRL